MLKSQTVKPLLIPRWRDKSFSFFNPFSDAILRSSPVSKKEKQHSFPIRLEDHAADSAGGRRLCRFPFLRHMGADVRHEERRRNAGTKHRLRCRWKNL